MKDIAAILIALAALLAGSLTDIKKREVPDWVNYGLMFTGFGVALISAIIYEKLSFIIESVTGFLFFFVLGALLFYTGQWGGGDTKMLMGLGALIGLQIPTKVPDTIQETPFILLFVGLTLVAGAAYGLLWALFMAIRKRKNFMKELKSRLQQRHIVYLKYLCIAFVVMMLLFSYMTPDPFVRIVLLIFGLAFPVLFYLSVSIRVVEKVCMIKKVSPKELTEGDWIEEEIMENKSKFMEPKVLDKKDVKKIRKKQEEYFVKIKRRFLGLKFPKTLHVSELKKGDVLLHSINKPVKIKSGELQKEDLSKLRQYGKYKFSTPKIRKKLLFFTFQAEFDEDSIKEGDELLQKLYFGEYISGPKDLGISKEDIGKLVQYQQKGRIKEVTIKEGIPFVPSFLIAFILALFLVY